MEVEMVVLARGGGVVATAAVDFVAQESKLPCLLHIHCSQE
jgi:hypothetical protein